jgi:ElaB/YqjD/DUF883 family membrane-anchored ribosome-binding protein
MNNLTEATGNDIDSLAHHARALMEATADVAGEKVREARMRLNTALENSREIYGRVRDKTVGYAKATDEAVHAYPYQAIGIAFGLGALVGFLVAQRNSD